MINLSLWKITLPIDSNGKFSGTAKEISQPTSSTSPYFILNEDSTITFSAPTDGARTSGSKYPRCELRELKQNGELNNWKISDGGRLSAIVEVNQVPVRQDGTPGRIIVGQIHGPDDELCRLYYDNGILYFVNDKAGSGKETTFYLLDASGKKTNIPLHEKFAYTIQVLGPTRKIIVTVTTKNRQIFKSDQPVGTFWTDSKTIYFKAGIYLGVSKPGSGAGVVGTGTGTCKFSKIDLTHGETEEKIIFVESEETPQPTNTPVPTPEPTPIPTPSPTQEPTSKTIKDAQLILTLDDGSKISINLKETNITLTK